MLEKLIKCFIKDSIQNMSSLKVSIVKSCLIVLNRYRGFSLPHNCTIQEVLFLRLRKLVCEITLFLFFELKEFLKAQTMCAESLQEYYSDDHNDEISTYVHINANVLNEIFSKNVSINFRCSYLKAKFSSNQILIKC